MCNGGQLSEEGVMAEILEVWSVPHEVPCTLDGILEGAVMTRTQLYAVGVCGATVWMVSDDFIVSDEEAWCLLNGRMILRTKNGHVKVVRTCERRASRWSYLHSLIEGSDVGGARGVLCIN